MVPYVYFYPGFLGVFLLFMGLLMKNACVKRFIGVGLKKQ
jgi:hypothetical protein